MNLGIKKQEDEGAYIDTGGGKPGTTFKSIQKLMKGFYKIQNEDFAGVLPMGKSAGATIWGTNGTTNPIFGAQMTVQMFNTQNAFSAIGARPYDHEGVRIVERLAQLGGIGADTARDGDIPDSVKPDIATVRQPYKELPFPWDYGLGLMTLQGFDDVIAFENYADIMAGNYGDNLDKDILRKTGFNGANPFPNASGQETTLQPLSRIIGAHSEIGKTYGTTNILASHVSPYGGLSGDVYGYRSVAPSTFDSLVVDGGGTLILDNYKKLYYGCAPYWNNQASPNNKMWIVSGPAIHMVDAEREANNRVITGSPDVYVKWSLDGVSTMPGMDAGGVTMRALYNIPAIMDNNLIVNRDVPPALPDDVPLGGFDPSQFGEQFLIDGDFIFYSMLTPIVLRSSDAFEITRKLRRVSVVHSRGEMRFNRATGHGKIVNTGA